MSNARETTTYRVEVSMANDTNEIGFVTLSSRAHAWSYFDSSNPFIKLWKDAEAAEAFSRDRAPGPDLLLGKSQVVKLQCEERDPSQEPVDQGPLVEVF
jgi:hypothetical protein